MQQQVICLDPGVQQRCQTPKFLPTHWTCCDNATVCAASDVITVTGGPHLKLQPAMLQQRPCRPAHSCCQTAAHQPGQRSLTHFLTGTTTAHPAQPRACWAPAAWLEPHGTRLPPWTELQATGSRTDGKVSKKPCCDRPTYCPTVSRFCVECMVCSNTCGVRRHVEASDLQSVSVSLAVHMLDIALLPVGGMAPQ